MYLYMNIIKQSLLRILASAKNVNPNEFYLGPHIDYPFLLFDRSSFDVWSVMNMNGSFVSESSDPISAVILL